jgi:thioredoxin-like negative regulator of GroEL
MMKLLFSLCLVVILCLFTTTTHAAEESTSFFDATSGITNFEPNQLQTQLKSASPLLVFFYTPRSGKSKNFQPELVKLAKALNGAVEVGALNCLEYQHDCEHSFEITSEDIPTLKLFVGKFVSKRYSGAPNVKNIASFINQALPSRVQPISAISTTDSELNRVVLFTDKKDIPTLFKSIALEFEGRLETFVAHSTESKDKSFIKKYKIDKFPTLLVENAATKEVTMYEDVVSYPNIRAFVVPHSSATKIKSPVVKEIRDQSCLARYCLESGAGLCVFVIPSETNMDKDLEIVADLQTQRTQASKMFAFSYISPSSENVMNFAIKAFGVQQGIPRAQVIVYSPKKDKFALYAGAYTPEAINEWLSIVEHGKARVGKLETADGKLPTIEGTTEHCPAPKKEEKKAEKKSKTEKPKKESKKDAKKDKPPTIREAEPGELDTPPGTQTSSTTIYPISSHNIEQMVYNSPDAWLLIFADHNDESRQIFGTLMQLAQKTGSLVKLGLIDMGMDKQITKDFDIDVGPSIRGFPCGVDKRDTSNINVYEGKNDAKSLYNYAMSLVVSNIVTILDSEKDFTSFMASSGAKKYTPHVVLFRSPSSSPVPPLLAALSHHFPKSIKFSATKNSEVKDIFAVKDRSPTIFAVNEPVEKDGLFSAEAVQYKGDMNFDALKNWLGQVAKGDVQYKRGRVIEWTKSEDESCGSSGDGNEGSCTAPPTEKSHDDL